MNGLGALSSVPGVDSVTLTSYLPINGAFEWDFQMDGQPLAEKGKRLRINGVVISPATSARPPIVVRGRAFTDQDGPGEPEVRGQVLGQPGPDGKRIRSVVGSEQAKPCLTCSGRLWIRQNDPMRPDIDPVVYVPLRQDPPGLISVMAHHNASR